MKEKKNFSKKNNVENCLIFSMRNICFRQPNSCSTYIAGVITTRFY